MVTDPPSIKALDPDTDPTNITYNMEGKYMYLITSMLFKMKPVLM